MIYDVVHSFIRYCMRKGCVRYEMKIRFDEYKKQKGSEREVWIERAINVSVIMPYV